MNKQQHIENIKNYLQNKPGYYKNGKLKTSYANLINKLDSNIILIKEAVNELKKGSWAIGTSLSKPKDDQLRHIEITKPGTYFVTGCVHAPFHNKRMYNSIYNYLSKEVNLEGIILAGDILDLHSLSRHDRGKIPLPGITLDQEYKGANEFLDELEDIQNINTKIFLYGNHEDRYFRSLSEVDTYKYGSALLSPSEALKLSNRGYQIIEDFKSGHIKFGNKLEINHGEFVNVHTAKKTIDTYRRSVLYFHTHRFQIYTEGLVGGWNMGWGGDINAPVFDYATRAMKNSWMNGAALVTLDKDGYYYVQPLLYINNQLIINGKGY